MRILPRDAVMDSKTFKAEINTDISNGIKLDGIRWHDKFPFSLQFGIFGFLKNNYQLTKN